LWFLTIELPAGSRIEYKLERVHGAERELILDPLNPRTARDPFGANSVFHGEGYETPDWCLPDAEARAGSLDQIVVPSEAFGDLRHVTIYRPARFRRQRRYPLLVAHDGTDFLRYASIKTVLDNLIRRLEIQPLIAAFVDPRDRLREYGADPRHAAFLTDELLPHLESRLPLVRRAAQRCLLGASFGAVASLGTAWRRPGVWDRLLLESGSFAFSDLGELHQRGAAFDAVVRFVNDLRERPGRPAQKVYLSCGVYESVIYENRSLVPVLQSGGVEVRYAEARDGHNWENWRDRLRSGLSWLFPGPLWMVYE
jgi:enterochelin esterase family protein